jgi:DNA modification methylase
LADFKQLSLFSEEFNHQSDQNGKVSKKSDELGTFKDSSRAPIHGWFRYPAGYSYKFVNLIFNKYDIRPGDWVYDPFSGSGTTLICAKQQAINAYGVEAHSFVHWVAEVKLFWEFNFNLLNSTIRQLLSEARKFVSTELELTDTVGIFPELVYKCYHPQDLKELYRLRIFINDQIADINIQNLFKLALTDTLRNAAAAGTGWPYIAPNKNTGNKPAKKALNIFEKTVQKMYRDLLEVAEVTPGCEILNILGDARNRQALMDNQIKLALTSPPYLNNYDYADRTRLETYFWGITKSWKDITQNFRDKLMVAATTQVNRSAYNVETALSQDLYNVDAPLYQTIQKAVLELARLRLTKGGKKDYDLMVALYFNGMLDVLQETFRVIEPGGHFCLILGDSAPYGVHIQTEELIGKLGIAIGFKNFDYTEFRTRGGKWKDNPQRHNVLLREGVVTLTK